MVANNYDKLEIASVFRDVGGTYAAERLLPPPHTAVLRDLVSCRTAVLGLHKKACVDCDFTDQGFNSCRNRHCPTCQSTRQRKWIEQRQAKVLPTHHFHVVFTLPAELRVLSRYDPVAVYDALFVAASRTLKTLGEQRLGGQLGITMVLHTWTREMNLHPHVHCIVTGGVLTRDDEPRWVAASKKFLFPVAVMRDLFRGKLMARLKRLRKAGKLRVPRNLADDDEWGTLCKRLFRKKWVVFAKRPFGGPHQVFAYLGRYTHRVAISSARLKEWDGKNVVFRTRADKVCKLDAFEFIRRFLLHILPRQFRKIRHYGLMSPTGIAKRLPVAKRCLTGVTDDATVTDDPAEAEPSDGNHHSRCPNCGGVVVILPGVFYQQDMPSPDSS